jgi:hypothetical protein
MEVPYSIVMVDPKVVADVRLQLRSGFPLCGFDHRFIAHGTSVQDATAEAVWDVRFP